MFQDFFNKVTLMQAHHQFMISLVVFTGISAIWWAGYVFFDEFFLEKIKTHYRVLFAFIIGVFILIGTHQSVTNLSGGGIDPQPTSPSR
jgi:threonine/homoserine/homoserine lactone efflux protein